ncbi:MAG: ABC transporter permease [Verrucomicrobiota bacterium]
MTESTSFLRRFFSGNQKTFGILGLLLLIFLITGLVEGTYWNKANLMNMSRYIGLYGIIAIGVSFVIITGGIDLSIGSLIGLMGVIFPILLVDNEASIPVAVATVLGLSLLIGLIHGLLITKLKLQPFLVTLCGLFIYRGIARSVAEDQTKGFGNDFVGLKETLVKGELFGLIPMPFVIVILIGIVAAILLNRTTFGRYLLALGRNEEAARFSGINTDLMKIFAYMICSLLGGFGAIMFVLDVNGATPSKFGNFYELWAISGAVLGGCSLRGGEGAIAGVICGAALVQITTSAVFFLGVADSHKFTVIGIFILIGVIVDELLKRYAARRRALQHSGDA